MVLRLNRSIVALWMALALLAGHYAANVHDLGHAIGQVAAGHDDGKPDKRTCETHFLCAQLGSAADATAPVVVALPADRVFHLPQVCIEAPQLTSLAYRSQAPPA